MATAMTGNWLEIKVTCDAEAAEDVATLFNQYGFKQGVTVEEIDTYDGADFAVKPGHLVTVRSALRSGDVPHEELEDTRNMLWVVRQALWVMGRSRAVAPLEIIERQDEDWANDWKRNFSVHQVGHRVLAKAPWQTYEAQSDEIVIELDPLTAFGTGRHPSTRLCMQALEEELKAGDDVLDVGIGAGLLATAAALLGARTVAGVDIDPVAIRSARANAERNGVGKIVRVELGSVGPGEPFQGPFDLVIANIITRVLIELAPDLTHVVAPGGTLILGGILDEKEVSVHEAFSAEHLTPVRRAQSEDWVALVWSKPV